MDENCKGCFQSGDCELYDHNIQEKCPCKECLVKITCRETCKPWIQYINDELYEIYKSRYGDHEATCGHVENKVRRLMLLRDMRGTIMVNPCVFK